MPFNMLSRLFGRGRSSSRRVTNRSSFRGRTRSSYRSSFRKQLVEQLEERRVLDASYFDLSAGSLTQDWSNAGLITANDDWLGVPSIVGFLGQNLTTATGVDARTVTGTSTVDNDIDVIANQTNPNTLSSGNVAEFAIANPVVAIQGSGTADAPYLQFHLNTTGRMAVRFQANLRDIDGSSDNAIQQINVQYRVGTSGVWENVNGGYFADVTTGPSLATDETGLDVTLPSAADNQAQVQVRVMTTNAAGNDEWVGIDDIVISSTAAGGDATPPTLVSMDDNDGDDTVASGDSLTYTVTFNEDIDAATVTPADFDNDGTAGIAIGTITETSAGVFSVQVNTTSAGSLRLRIPTGSVITDVAGNALVVPVSDDTEVTVTAGDITPPTVVSITDDDADDIIGVGAMVTYTVTFSEDIDENTVSAADFNNAGTSTVTFGTITETSPGVFTIPVTATSAGTVQLRIPTDATILDVAGNALVVDPAILDAETITVDGTAPTLTSIGDNISGGPGFTNSPITFTVTFNEDIDAATVTADDFDNAGTATVTFGAINETSPGVFSVVVTPTTVGTVQLRIPTTAVISDVTGNNLDVTTALLDDTVITVNAVTTLTVGDLSIIGFNSNTPDGFAFVSWVDLLPGTVIKFTDNAFLSAGSANAANNARGGENFVTWSNSTGSTIAAGTVITIVDGTPATTNAGSVVQRLSGISNSGDNIFAYQGAGAGTTTTNSDFVTNSNPTTFTGSIVFGLVFGSEFLTDGTASSNTTYLPSELNVANGNIALSTASTSRGQYTGARTATSIAELKALVTNPSNWTSDTGAGVITLDTTAFTFAADTTPPTVTAIDDNDPDDIVLVNEMLTYTIAFSEDIIDSGDGAVTAADFDNGAASSPSAITIGTITETSAGIFSVQVTPTTAGNLQLRIPTGAVITDVAGNALVVPMTANVVVTVNANDVTPPTVVSITDDDADDIVGVGATVTYTVTFSEDINAGTVSAADFDNAGNSTFTIGTITETSAGVFTIPVTATSAGTLQLRIPTTATIQDLNNNLLVVDPPILDAETITVDGTAPTLASITDSISGGPSFTNQPITFTVTFNEDIDAATVTAADFDNAGTSTITIGAINETSAGVFTVVVTPTTAGTVQLRIPTGSVVADVAGNNLDVTTALLDDTIISVNAVTTLTAGDIAFTSFRSDGDDRFSFVLLKDIADGTSIAFTDNRWNDDNTLATNENAMTVMFLNGGLGFAAGTHFVYDNAVTPVGPRVLGSTGLAGTVTGAISGLATGGDSILAYQGAAPTDGNSAAWIAGINSRSWNNSPTGNSQSALPTALTVGINAIQLTDTATDIDNGAYQPPLFIGSIAQIRASVNNIANWQTSNDPGPVSTTQFIIGEVSTDLFISEVVFDPEAASDTGEEYLELRGTPNAYVPADAYLVMLDGDSEDGAGLIDHVFYIAGMQLGSNGFLVLRQFGSSYAVDPAANVFTATSSGWGADWSSRSTDIENGSVTVMIMQSAAAPVPDADVDSDNDGTLDGVATSWTIRDAIGNIDGGATDTAYGFLNTSGNGNGLVPAGSTFVNLSGYHPDYMARNGNSTGYTLVNSAASDWVVGELAGAMPTITLATGGFTRPAIYAGAAVDDLGAVNSFTAGLADPVLTVTAGNAVYTAAVYAGASVSITGAVEPIPTATLTYFVGTGTTGEDLGSAAPTNVGTYTVVASTLANSANNAATSQPVTFQITPAPLTPTATASTKVYDGTPAATVAISLAGVLGSDVISGTASGTFDNENVGSGKAVTVGAVTLAGAASSNYVVGAAANTTASITAKSLSATGSAADKVYDGTTSAAVTLELTGFIPGDTVTATGTGNFANANVGMDKPVTLSNLLLDGADAGNYIIGTTNSPTADITAKELTITAEAKSKIYGEADPALTFGASGLIGSDAITGALTRVDGENVGAYAIQKGTVTAGSNYSITYVGANLTITPRELTITADAKSKLFGQADPLLTFSVNGLVATDSIAGSLTRDPGEVVGTYAILQGSVAVAGAASANYSVTYIGASLTISAAAPAVSSVMVNGADAFLTPSQRSLITSLTVSFDTTVALASGAFTLLNLDTNTVVENLIISPNAASTQFTLRFGTGAGVLPRAGSGIAGNALLDGNYRLQIDATKVSANGSAMAADYFFGDVFEDKFFALFGDADGDGDVDGTDTIALRRHARGLEYNAALDFDGDGVLINDLEDVNAYNANRNKLRRRFN